MQFWKEFEKMLDNILRSSNRTCRGIITRVPPVPERNQLSVQWQGDTMDSARACTRCPFAAGMRTRTLYYLSPALGLDSQTESWPSFDTTIAALPLQLQGANEATLPARATTLGNNNAILVSTCFYSTEAWIAETKIVSYTLYCDIRTSCVNLSNSFPAHFVFTFTYKLRNYTVSKCSNNLHSSSGNF